LIKVTDVGGNVKYINCELIEKIEIIPDTLLVLTNGHNFIVSDKPEDIIERIIDFKQQCSKYHSDVLTVEHKVEPNRETDSAEEESTGN